MPSTGLAALPKSMIVASCRDHSVNLHCAFFVQRTQHCAYRPHNEGTTCRCSGMDNGQACNTTQACINGFVVRGQIDMDQRICRDEDRHFKRKLVAWAADKLKLEQRGPGASPAAGPRASPAAGPGASPAARVARTDDVQPPPTLPMMARGPPRWSGLCSHINTPSLWGPRAGRGYVAKLRFPHFGDLTWQPLCSHKIILALWQHREGKVYVAIFVCPSYVDPKKARVIAILISSRCGDPQDGREYVATLIFAHYADPGKPWVM